MGIASPKVCLKVIFFVKFSFHSQFNDTFIKEKQNKILVYLIGVNQGHQLIFDGRMRSATYL